MLPDCECKGRAFLHSLQDFAEKKCEKISFAPILPLHSIAKSAVKLIFSPLPHPPFSLQDLRFSRFSPFRTQFRAIFRGNALVFCPAKPIFFSSFLVLGPTSDTFSRNLSHFSLRTPLFAQHEGFSDSGFPFLHPLPHLHISIDFLSALHSPSLFTTPPLSFSFLPTFPSLSPINARTRAPSRTTRVRVRPHLPARQEIFVYCLHLFTHLPQSTVHQLIRCEEKREKAFTKLITPSQSVY